jgi:hypothetical protein
VRAKHAWQRCESCKKRMRNCAKPWRISRWVVIAAYLGLGNAESEKGCALTGYAEVTHGCDISGWV